MNLATSRRRPLRGAAALACMAFIGVAHAQEAPSRSLWEIGGVAVGAWQQAYPGSDQQLRRGLALPFLVYRGRFLRADNEGVGVRPVRTPVYEFDISAAFAFGSDADQDPAR